MREPGYDGEYGTIRLFQPGELDRSAVLFDVQRPPSRPRAGRRADDRAPIPAPRGAGSAEPASPAEQPQFGQGAGPVSPGSVVSAALPGPGSLVSVTDLPAQRRRAPAGPPG